MSIYSHTITCLYSANLNVACDCPYLVAGGIPAGNGGFYPTGLAYAFCVKLPRVTVCLLPGCAEPVLVKHSGSVYVQFLMSVNALVVLTESPYPPVMVVTNADG